VISGTLFPTTPFPQHPSHNTLPTTPFPQHPSTTPFPQHRHWCEPVFSESDSMSIVYWGSEEAEALGSFLIIIPSTNLLCLYSSYNSKRVLIILIRLKCFWQYTHNLLKIFINHIFASYLRFTITIAIYYVSMIDAWTFVKNLLFFRRSNSLNQLIAFGTLTVSHSHACLWAVSTSVKRTGVPTGLFQPHSAPLLYPNPVFTILLQDWWTDKPRLYQFIPVYTCLYLFIPVYTCLYLFIPVY